MRTRRRRSRCRLATPTATTRWTFAKGTLPTNGSLGAIGAVTCNHLTPNVCTADVVYTPNPDYLTARTASRSRPMTGLRIRPRRRCRSRSIRSTTPRVLTLEGGAIAYTENDPATAITAGTTVADDDSADFDTGTLTVDSPTGDRRRPAGNPRPGDGHGQIGVSGGERHVRRHDDRHLHGRERDHAAGGHIQPARHAPRRRRWSATSPSATCRRTRGPRHKRCGSVVTDGDGGTSAAVTRASASRRSTTPRCCAGSRRGRSPTPRTIPALRSRRRSRSAIRTATSRARRWRSGQTRRRRGRAGVRRTSSGSRAPTTRGPA